MTTPSTHLWSEMKESEPYFVGDVLVKNRAYLYTRANGEIRTASIKVLYPTTPDVEISLAKEIDKVIRSDNANLGPV